MPLNRRQFVRIAGAGLTAPWVPLQIGRPRSARNVIFILLQGAPSQIDTFDFREGPWTPADFRPVTINGIDFPEGLLPNLARQLSRFAIVRSCQSTALVHSLSLAWSQIARSPASATGRISPNMGSVVAFELERERKPTQTLPGFVALNGSGTLVRQGYFSSRYSPFDVTPNANGLTTLQNADGLETFNERFELLGRFAGAGVQRPEFSEMTDFHLAARRMMYDPAVSELFRYAQADQQRYGNSGFGNACIVARNLVSANLGTRYVQITQNGWDHHQGIYLRNGLYRMALQFDPALANLVIDLAAAPGVNGGSLLDETLVVAKGEFGRTVGPLVGDQGRDHHFVHSALFAGGGVSGGRAIGRTTPDGHFVELPGWSQDRPVAAEDVAATIYHALGIDHTTVRNDDPLGRGFEYVPASPHPPHPIEELFG